MINSLHKCMLLILVSTASLTAQITPMQQSTPPSTTQPTPFDTWLTQANNAISQLNSMAQQLSAPNNIERIKTEATSIAKDVTSLGTIDPAQIGNITQAVAAKTLVSNLIQSTQTLISTSYTRYSNPYNAAVIAEITRLNTVIHAIASDITTAITALDQSVGQVTQAATSAGVSVNFNAPSTARPNPVMRSDLSPRVSGVAEVASIAQAGAQLNGYQQALRTGTTTAGTLITALRSIVTKKNNLITRYNWVVQNTQPIKNVIAQMRTTYQTLAPQANQAISALRQASTTTAQLNTANQQTSTLSSLANRITSQITNFGTALTSIDTLCAQINQRLSQK